MAEMRPAVEMKDSGIEWVGQIPRDWRVVPIRSCFDEVIEKNKDGLVKNALKFTYGEIVPKTNFNAEEDDYVADTILNYYVVYPGTIMINGLNLNFDYITQRTGLVKEKGIITSAYVGIAPKDSFVTLPEFMNYLFKAYDYRMAFHNMGGGVRKILNYTRLKSQMVCFPDLAEQQAIADYLDDRCSKIDEIIAEATASIEEYKELKQAVIFEAVTKGLDKTVPMKKSNVGWIDTVPCSWNVGKLRLLAEFYNGDRSSRYPSGDDIKSEGIIFVTSNNLGNIRLNIDSSTNKYITKEKYDELGGAKLRIDDIVFCLRGSVGKCSINKLFDAGTIASSLVVIRPKKIYPDYLNYVLQTSRITDEAIVSAIGIGSANLAAHDISEFFVPVPSIVEQREIVDYLDVCVGEMDSLISEKQSLISDLQAYKKSLIYEVVTGKRRVV